MKKFGIELLSIFLLISLQSCQTPQEAETGPEPDMIVEVDAGEHDRFDTLLSLEVDKDWETASVIEVTGGLFTPFPAQIDPLTRELLWVLNDETPRRTVRVFNIYGNRNVPEHANFPPIERVQVIDEPGRYLELQNRGTPVLRYNYGTVIPPNEKIPEIQSRNAYIHPVWTPAGQMVTDDFHPDHLHQRGLWFAWTETQYEDRTPDFWNLGDGTGTVRFRELASTFEGISFGGFQAEHDHVDLSAPDGEETVLSETFTVRVYSLGGKNEGYFLFDLVSEQRAVGDSPLILPEYHYGGLGFRGAREWTPEQVTFLTSEGLNREEGDGSRADWCAVFGRIEKRFAGAAIFSHPDNFRAPQPLRIHPEMPYFAYTPVRLGEMSITADEPLRSKYRVLVFDGQISSDLATAYWRDYADPPEIRIR